MVRQRAAANPFSSPAGSPSKRSRNALSTSELASPSRTNASFVSSSAVFRTPQHSDAVPVSTILSHVEIVSPSSLPDPSNPIISASQQSPTPTFLCRRVYDVKPVPGASFWGEIEWDEHREKAVGWYESTMEIVERREGTRERDVAQDGWDVEAVMEDSESESENEEERVRRHRRAEKARATKERKAKEREERRAAQGAMSESDASSDDQDDDDAFVSCAIPLTLCQLVDHPLPQNDRDSASSDSDSDSHGDDSDEGSASDDDRASRTSTKRKPLRERQPTASSTVRKAAATRAKRSGPATSAATGRAAKRRKFASSGKASSGPSSHNALPPLIQSVHLASLTPFERAKALLHVSATPESLPCREDQREQIRQFIGDAVLGRSGGCLYVHGVPGTGKTATVHSVVRELQNDEVRGGHAFQRQTFFADWC